MLDFSSDFGAKAFTRLKNEEGIWLTTVGADGAPHPNPVWFIWEDNESFLIFTQPDSQKVKNLRRNHKVSLNFDAKLDYEEVVVFAGEAELNAEFSPESKAAYIEKYEEEIDRIDMTVESFFQSFSVPVRVRVTRLRGLPAL